MSCLASRTCKVCFNLATPNFFKVIRGIVLAYKNKVFLGLFATPVEKLIMVKAASFVTASALVWWVAIYNIAIPELVVIV